MKPYLPFIQTVVHPTMGHCFAISVKWVGLMLEDTEGAEDYLTRTTSRSAETRARTWRTTKARMAASIVAGEADVPPSGPGLGLPAVQCNLAGPWIRKYSKNGEASVQVLHDDLDDALALANVMVKSECEAFIVSASTPPHTIGIVYDGDVHWFDPNHGVFNLGDVGGRWEHSVKEICLQTGFRPDWVLGVTL